jgi:DNA-binding YbaB/EbfC family protein
MFKELGQITSLLRNLPKMKEQMDQLRTKLGQITAEGTAGGGMVTVKANGHLELTSCTISPEAMTDKELLEGLVKAAANQALQKCRELVAEETSKMGSQLGLPGGMDLSNLS